MPQQSYFSQSYKRSKYSQKMALLRHFFTKRYHYFGFHFFCIHCQDFGRFLLGYKRKALISCLCVCCGFTSTGCVKYIAREGVNPTERYGMEGEMDLDELHDNRVVNAPF